MFINLTAVISDITRTVFVQVSHIVAVSTNNEKKTTILLSVGEDIVVLETVKEVLSLISGKA